MNSAPQGRDPYLVKSVVHSSKILSAFRTAGEALPLREIAIRSGLPKTMAFRLLYTLEKCVPGATGSDQHGLSEIDALKYR